MIEILKVKCDICEIGEGANECGMYKTAACPLRNYNEYWIHKDLKDVINSIDEDIKEPLDMGILDKVPKCKKKVWI